MNALYISCVVVDDESVNGTLKDESGTLCLFVTTEFKVLASLQRHV